MSQYLSMIREGNNITWTGRINLKGEDLFMKMERHQCALNSGRGREAGEC